MQAKQYEGQVIEMQPMLDTAVQPPLLEVRRGRASPQQTAALPGTVLRITILNLALVLLW